MYKYIALFVVVVVCFIGMGMNNSYNTRPWQLDTLFSAETATGTTSSIATYTIPMSEFNCVAVWGGTAPTNIVFTIKGSLDGTTYANYKSFTMLASGQSYTVIGTPSLYLESTYDSRSVGDATTSLTLKCLGVGN